MCWRKNIFRKGQTLMELLIVVIIIGMLASYMLIRYDTMTERMRATEGVNHLIAILGAERRWFSDHGVYTTQLSDLDFQMSNGWNNFNGPSLFAVPLNSDQIIASIPRNALAPFDYTLSVTENKGTITCSGGGAGICAKLGF